MSEPFDTEDQQLRAEALADNLYKQFGRQALVAATTGLKFAEYANDAEEQALYKAALKILEAKLSGSQ